MALRVFFGVLCSLPVHQRSPPGPEPNLDPSNELYLRNMQLMTGTQLIEGEGNLATAATTTMLQSKNFNAGQKLTTPSGTSPPRQRRPL